MDVVEVDGIKFPKFFENNTGNMKDHIEHLKTLDMKEDDVIICAFPKSGTHWLWEVISMLQAGSTQYQTKTKEFTMMEATGIEDLQAMPSPRILNTHVPIHFLPRQFREKKVKIIHVYRNLKDIVVSLYFHAVQQFHSTSIDFLLGNFIEHNNKGSFVNYMKEVDAFMKNEADHPVFNVSFEDTKEDPLKTVTSLAEFLRVKASPELCAAIVEATEFSKLKEADSKRNAPAGLPPAQMYRKGVVGDWKNHLTVAQSELLELEVEKLKDCNFKFRYTL